MLGNYNATIVQVVTTTPTSDMAEVEGMIDYFFKGILLLAQMVLVT